MYYFGNPDFGYLLYVAHLVGGHHGDLQSAACRLLNRPLLSKSTKSRPRFPGGIQHF